MPILCRFAVLLLTFKLKTAVGTSESGSCYDVFTHTVTCDVMETSCSGRYYAPGYVGGSGCCHCSASCNHNDETGAHCLYYDMQPTSPQIWGRSAYGSKSAFTKASILPSNIGGVVATAKNDYKDEIGGEDLISTEGTRHPSESNIAAKDEDAAGIEDEVDEADDDNEAGDYAEARADEGGENFSDEDEVSEDDANKDEADEDAFDEDGANEDEATEDAVNAGEANKDKADEDEFDEDEANEDEPNEDAANADAVNAGEANEDETDEDEGDEEEEDDTVGDAKFDDEKDTGEDTLKKELEEEFEEFKEEFENQIEDEFKKAFDAKFDLGLKTMIEKKFEEEFQEFQENVEPIWSDLIKEAVVGKMEDEFAKMQSSERSDHLETRLIDLTVRLDMALDDMQAFAKESVASEHSWLYAFLAGVAVSASAIIIGCWFYKKSRNTRTSFAKMPRTYPDDDSL